MITEKIEKYLEVKSSLNEHSMPPVIVTVVDNFVRYFMGDSNAALSFLKQHQNEVQKFMKNAELHLLGDEEYQHYYDEFYKELLRATDKWLSYMTK